MISTAQYVEKLLLNPVTFDIIADGNPFQFEDFWKYVESDLPDYLQTLKAHLETLELKEKELNKDQNPDI